MARKLCIVVGGLAVVAVLSPGSASAQAGAQANADPGVKHIRNIADGPQNKVTAQILSSGVRTCAGRIDQVANFLTRGTQSSALVFVPERDADNSMISISAEVQAEGVPRAYASATFSPNTAMGCSGMYESVQYWNESCNVVAAKNFKGGTPGGPLGSEIAILNIGLSARVFLVRATSTSCVTIKKEVLR
jgi:hypothetical protein